MGLATSVPTATHIRAPDTGPRMYCGGLPCRPGRRYQRGPITPWLKP